MRSTINKISLARILWIRNHRSNSLVIQCEAGSLELQAEKMAEKYPNVDGICRELQKKYTYAEEEYMVVAPENIFAIIKEGRMLHHCVGNDGSGERYYERMERRFGARTEAYTI